MATLLTPAEKGRIILNIYKHYNIRAGQALSQKIFTQMAMRLGVSAQDISDGIDYAYEQGWVEAGVKGSVLLTEAGFAAM